MRTEIQPVQVFPKTATHLFVRPVAFGPPPAFYFELQTAAVETLKSGNVEMTDAQWNAWGTAANDADYILAAVAANLGLEII